MESLIKPPLYMSVFSGSNFPEVRRSGTWRYLGVLPLARKLALCLSFIMT
jgi:hypothetical protein